MLASRSPLQDSESFSNLFARTHLIIFRFIYGLHGGPLEEVEDLTSDTYSRAWKGCHRFSGDENDALCWLFTIARHLVIDTHRKKKNQLNDTIVRLDDTTLSALFSSSELTPEEQATNQELFTHLWEVMQGLQDDRREMLTLRYILGWQV